MKKENIENMLNNFKIVIRNDLDYLLRTQNCKDLLSYITDLQQQNKKQKEVIDKAIEFINNNGAKQYNHHDNYRGKWYSPDELDTILDILKEVE